MTDALRVLVVDDEPHARARLGRLLARMPEVTVIGEADNGRSALALIGELAPDVVLLDIEMPGLDGLAVGEAAAEIASGAGAPAPAVVFTTAHSRFALDAFELDADDYLLKPVVAERLARALAKARRRLGLRRPPPPVEATPGAPPPTAATPSAPPPERESVAGPEPPDDESPGPPGAEAPRDPAQLVVHDRGVTRFFDARGVTRFRAVDKYTSFVVEGAECLTRESLSALEARLGPLGFVRVHRADLVRLDAVRALEPEPGGALVHLADGQVVQVSRRFLPKLRKALGLRG
ncbi:MAG TPA: LytTR family DNA-binding domain-containing protein, partial [Polyangiaceae bacterium]|nr:LytTR family DNA-binding domain-containing protein [Polyangiaceae bacterium]